MSTLMIWLRSFLERRLEREKVRFVCVSLLTISLVLAAVSFLTFDGTYSIFGPAPGFDFVGFYAAGRILNHYPPPRLYDLELQGQVFHEVLPGSHGRNGGCRMSILLFFALLFRPLALVPYGIGPA